MSSLESKTPAFGISGGRKCWGTEGAEYTPFEYPKLSGWVNCNLWIGDGWPTTLGPLKDPNPRFQWKKDTLKSAGLTQADEDSEEVDGKNWT